MKIKKIVAILLSLFAMTISISCNKPTDTSDSNNKKIIISSNFNKYFKVENSSRIEDDYNLEDDIYVIKYNVYASFLPITRYDISTVNVEFEFNATIGGTSEYRICIDTKKVKLNQANVTTSSALLLTQSKTSASHESIQNNTITIIELDEQILTPSIEEKK